MYTVYGLLIKTGLRVRLLVRQVDRWSGPAAGRHGSGLLVGTEEAVGEVAESRKYLLRNTLR